MTVELVELENTIIEHEEAEEIQEPCFLSVEYEDIEKDIRLHDIIPGIIVNEKKAPRDNRGKSRPGMLPHIDWIIVKPSLYNKSDEHKNSWDNATSAYGLSHHDHKKFGFSYKLDGLDFVCYINGDFPEFKAFEKIAKKPDDYTDMKQRLFDLLSIHIFSIFSRNHYYNLFDKIEQIEDTETIMLLNSALFKSYCIMVLEKI